MDHGGEVLTNEDNKAVTLMLDGRMADHKKRLNDEFDVELEGEKRSIRWIIEHEMLAAQGGLTHDEVKELQDLLIYCQRPGFDLNI